jgi:L-lactate dehydrogenase complex protein LldG
MSGTRDAMLDRIRASIGSDGARAERAHAVETRIRRHARNLVPKRGQLDPKAQVALFVEMARAASATIERVACLDDVPAAASAFLVRYNLPPKLKLAPDPSVAQLPWDRHPLLKIETGRAMPDDVASLTPAFAAVAETGTLMLVSGPTRPTTLNFLPENHIVVLRAGQVVGSYEDGWDRLRAEMGEAWPRTVNFITGPSRSADIEQQLQMGAHGPKRLHIILVAEEGAEGHDGQRQG